MRKHNPALFIECLATEIVETYKHMVRIREEQEKYCFQNGYKEKRFFTFFEIKYFKTVS